MGMFPLGEGDLIVIGPNQMHRDRSGTTEYIVFHFDHYQYLDPTTLSYSRLFTGIHAPLSRLNYIFAENTAAKRRIARCVKDIYMEAKNKAPGYEMAISLLIRKILLTLMRYDTRQMLPVRDHAEIVRLKSFSIISRKTWARKSRWKKRAESPISATIIL